MESGSRMVLSKSHIWVNEYLSFIRGFSTISRQQHEGCQHSPWNPRRTESMCPVPQLPTWEEAKTTVFDSTLSSEDTHWHVVTTSGRHTWQHTPQRRQRHLLTLVRTCGQRKCHHTHQRQQQLHGRTGSKNNKTTTTVTIPTWLETKTTLFDISHSTTVTASYISLIDDSPTTIKRNNPMQTANDCVTTHTRRTPPVTLNTQTPHTYTPSITTISNYSTQVWLPHTLQQTDSHILNGTQHTLNGTYHSLYRTNHSCFEWNIPQTLLNN